EPVSVAAGGLSGITRWVVLRAGGSGAGAAGVVGAGPAVTVSVTGSAAGVLRREQAQAWARFSASWTVAVSGSSLAVTASLLVAPLERVWPGWVGVVGSRVGSSRLLVLARWCSHHSRSRFSISVRPPSPSVPRRHSSM